MRRNCRARLALTTRICCPKPVRMPNDETRSVRLELRTSPLRAERIRRAARLANQSVSAFVLEAASHKADEIVASSATIVSATFFDELWRGLDAAPRANPRLSRQARRRRQVVSDIAAALRSTR